MPYQRNVLPNAFAQELMQPWENPTREINRNLTMALLDNEFGASSSFRNYLIRSRNKTGGGSTTSTTPGVGKYQEMVCVSQFKPEEISIKATETHVIVHGKHEEVPDEHGFVSREFTRRYMVPPGVDSEQITCSLSPDGLLIIEAPRKVTDSSNAGHRVIPVNLIEPTPMSGQQKYRTPLDLIGEPY